MTCQSRNLIFLCLLILLNLSCFKKQSHDIVKPEFPNYTLTIHIENIDNGEPMGNVKMIFASQEGIFASSQFEGVSDNSGLLVFNKVYTDIYSFSCRIHNILIMQDYFYMGFRDTTLTIEIPNLLYVSKQYLFPNKGDQWSRGICWKDANTLATLGTWKPDKESQKSFVRLFEGNLEDGLKVIGAEEFEQENPSMTGLIWVPSNYYSFTGGFDEPTICILDRSGGRLVGQFPAPHRLVDLAYDGQYIWATATNYKILKFTRSSPSPIDEFPSPGKHPSAIAYDGSHIWSYDNGTHWLYRHENDGHVSKTWALGYLQKSKFGDFDTNVTDLQKMVFDFNGLLYVPYGDNILVYAPSDK